MCKEIRVKKRGSKLRERRRVINSGSTKGFAKEGNPGTQEKERVDMLGGEEAKRADTENG